LLCSTVVGRAGLLSASVTAVAAALETTGRLLVMLVLVLLLLAMCLWSLPTVYDVLDIAAAKLCSAAGTQVGICKIAELLDSKSASMPA
jgi:hypothetical protein